ncbi:MAG: DUF1800 domain-containing protein [Fimbriimonadaceae bacterium]|nr:DUF1800 domain-containing protein [Fimbriimonadaceae bacterium]NUM38086.1 DUF1800 domain-containing protein [Armatimonadota bacterium]
MDERAKIKHLLRRFGFGAGKWEVESYLPLGLDGAIERLIEYEKVDERFPVSPWEFARDSEGALGFDPFRFASWWGLRLLLTHRPLQERLTLFWHDHFAVSGAKVFDGPAMVFYQETLRKHAAGNFRDLLKGVCREPAMMFWLDNAQSVKDHPNENFARELLELFTMGGGYTEKDIFEVARAFTGWSVHFGGLGDESEFYKQQEAAARKGRSVFNFCVVPAFHDEGPKTILGKTGPFGGEEVLDLVAERPETARTIVRKLWEWFAYPDPDPSVVERLAGVFTRSGMQIRPVLRSIVASDEFWSEKCVHGRPKSPIDFTLGLFRSLALSEVLLALRGQPTDPFQSLRKEVRGAADGLSFLMNGQGFLPHFPPDVGGWEWGENWLTSNNMKLRIQHADILFWGDDPNRPIAVYLAQRLKTEFAPKSAGEIVDALAEVFDAEVSALSRDTLLEACARAGGPSALDEKDRAAGLFATVCRVLFASPEFQLC